ncbi:SDR family oxidoreductase [Erythrobacter sp. Alg231-14]|uniref:SDR family oxidoreductase n=1 Tax=Erythrobacter sp. Alg231-14 TaxID=1922225 RepID=UPI000D54ED4C
MPDLKGKVAIVTGCASGIGAATVRRLRADGAEVLGTDINTEWGEPVCEEAGAAFAVHDVADFAAWPDIVAQAVDRWGRLDILVNNAGTVSSMSIEDVTDEMWDRIYNINIKGTMAGCRAAIAAMKENPFIGQDGSSGSIINISSTSAIGALPSDVAYCSSKGAVRVLSKSVATHCAKQGYNIRCNTVIPGATDTNILAQAENVAPGLKEAVAATSPMNRLADPSETASAIAFLASDECAYMTGSELLVDGAMMSIHPGF